MCWGLLVGCTGSQSGTVPGRTVDRYPTVVVDPVEGTAGLEDLTCGLAWAEPLQWTWNGQVRVAGTGTVRVPARDVVAGQWVCEAPSGDAAPVAVEVTSASHNLLVVVLDDVGIDNVGVYGVGADPPPTPTLDGLAARGVRFENAWAMPVCSSTRAALLTGRYPRRSGIGTVVDVLTPFGLPDAEVTVAEMLGDAGYGTALTGKWHLSPWREGWLTEPLAQGFDHYAGSMHNLPIHQQQPLQNLPTGYYLFEKNTDGILSWRLNYATTDTTDDAIAAMGELPEPWFVMVSYNAAHEPWDRPPPALYTAPDPTTMAERFDVVVEAMDTEIGRLVAALGPLEDRTTLVVLGDNGTPEGVLESPVDAAQYKGTFAEGGVRVPWIVAGPLVRDPGSISTTLVSVVDLLPTATALAGFVPDDDVLRDGFSLLPYLVDPDYPSARDVLYAEKFRPNGHVERSLDFRVVRDGQHRLARDLTLGEVFTRLGPGALEESEDLLQPGAVVSVDDLAALTRLRASLAALEASLER